MKFKDLLRDILYEQPNPEDPEIDPEDEGNHMDDEGNLVDADGNIIEPALDDNGAVQLDEPVEPEDDEDNVVNPQPRAGAKPEGPKKLSRTQQIKLKWKEENPALTDQQASDAIAFFNDRKDRLRPYHPYGYVDPTNNRHYVNLPEITALVDRFPDMEEILSDPVRMKDLGNYSWEAITFYQDRIYRQAIEMDNENWVKGDLTEDQRIQMALQRWTKPYNQLINDGTLTVYKVECKAEAIALGALDHAIFRKYKDDKVLKTLPPETQREIKDQTWASQPWCVARPIGGKYGSNLWTNYRPKNAFYFLLDRSKPEWNEYHVVALQSLQNGGFIISTMLNHTTFPNWDEIETIYPGLRGKKKLFPWFGTTQRERKELTLDTLSFVKGSPYDFALQPDAVHRTYIENGRYIPNVRAFLRLSFENRKLYIDKTKKENDDYKLRFLCDDPNNPFGILEVLRTERIKDFDPYKYLDVKILQTNLGIADGIMAIKQSLIGTNWRRWLTDIDSGQTLISTKSSIMRTDIKPRYGIMSIDNAQLIKDVRYQAEAPKSYGLIKIKTDDNGRQKKYIDKKYIFQKFMFSLGDGRFDPNEYFYFLCLVDAFTNRESDHYLKGKYYDGRDGDTFIQNEVSRGELMRL